MPSGIPSTHRIGLIVPSSNVTMEIEVPAMLQHAVTEPLSFHSSRMAMRQVSAEELKDMDKQSERCAAELSDARCEVLAYACLVAVMVQGAGAHRLVEERLAKVCRSRGLSIPVISSAGALVNTAKKLGVKRVALVAPYMPALTDTVISYFKGEGIEVSSSVSLSVSDNYEVGCIPGDRLRAAVNQLNLDKADVLILSACVQMPSLPLLESIEDQVGLPVITAASATSAAILHALGQDARGVPGAAGGAWNR